MTVNCSPCSLMVCPGARVHAAVEPFRQLLGHQRDLLAEIDVARIEETAGKHDQIADRSCRYSSEPMTSSRSSLPLMNVES